MSVMSTGLFPQDLRPGIRQWFGQAYKAYDTKYDKMVDVKVPDDRAYEEDVMMSALGLAQVKPQGATVQYDSGNQLFTTRYVHIQYGLGFQITQEMMEDGIALKYGQVFVENLKLNMLRSREIIVASVYTNAFSSSFTMEAGDGVQLGSSAHPTPAGNFSNVPTTPGTLSEATLEQAVIDISLYKDNRGNLIAVRPTALIVHPNNMFNARRILRSDLRSTTADNDINALRSMDLLQNDPVVNPYLTSTTNWHLRTDQPGLVMFNRKDIGLEDDNDFDTNNMKVKGLMRLSVGWSDPRAIYAVNA